MSSVARVLPHAVAPLLPVTVAVWGTAARELILPVTVAVRGTVLPSDATPCPKERKSVPSLKADGGFASEPAENCAIDTATDDKGLDEMFTGFCDQWHLLWLLCQRTVVF